MSTTCIMLFWVQVIDFFKAFIAISLLLIYYYNQLIWYDLFFLNNIINFFIPHPINIHILCFHNSVSDCEMMPLMQYKHQLSIFITKLSFFVVFTYNIWYLIDPESNFKHKNDMIYWLKQRNIYYHCLVCFAFCPNILFLKGNYYCGEKK